VNRQQTSAEPQPEPAAIRGLHPVQRRWVERADGVLPALPPFRFSAIPTMTLRVLDYMSDVCCWSQYGHIAKATTPEVAAALHIGLSTARHAIASARSLGLLPYEVYTHTGRRTTRQHRFYGVNWHDMSTYQNWRKATIAAERDNRVLSRKNAARDRKQARDAKK
jgi:hypothetical protein